MKILLFMNKEMVVPPREETPNIEYYHKAHGNTGNRIFYNAIYKYINTNYNDIYFSGIENNKIANYTYDEVNNAFDLFVIPSLIFEVLNESKKAMEELIDGLEKIHIPIIAFSVSCQAINISIEDFIRYYKTDMIRFAKAVLNSGGAIALRGYYTEKVFNSIGINETTVTGCASFYQNGRQWSEIVKKDVKKDSFRIAINGDINILKSKMIRRINDYYKDCIYIDQSFFFENYLNMDQNSIIEKIKMIKNLSITGYKLLRNNKVRYFFDFGEWSDYIKNFSFSFGKRIHGNIIALLSGIPAYVVCSDTRTREMAEFFSIPYNDERILATNLDPYDLYRQADYRKLNMSYKEKFDTFENFLVKNNIVKNLNHLNG